MPRLMITDVGEDIEISFWANYFTWICTYCGPDTSFDRFTSSKQLKYVYVILINVRMIKQENWQTYNFGLKEYE